MADPLSEYSVGTFTGIDQEDSTTTLSDYGIGSFEAPEKLDDDKWNIWYDTIDSMQHKLDMEELPYVERETSVIPSHEDARKSWYHGLHQGYSGLLSTVAGIPGWIDRINDKAINLLGGDPNKWRFEYLYGNEFSKDNAIVTNEDYNNIEKKVQERLEFKEWLGVTTPNEKPVEVDSTSKLPIVINPYPDDPKKQLAYGAYISAITSPLNTIYQSVRDRKFRWSMIAGWDAASDVMKEMAVEALPNNADPDYFGNFQPETTIEKTIAGFGAVPGTVASIATATAITRNPMAGFATVAFLQNSDQPAGTVIKNTFLAGLEGRLIGGAAKLPTWGQRVGAFGTIGMGSAYMHSDKWVPQFSDIASSGIVMASFGFIPTGKATDASGFTDAKTRINYKGEVQGADPSKTGGTLIIEKGADRIHTDIQKLDAHMESVVTFKDNKNRSGYNVETKNAIPEFDPVTNQVVSEKGTKTRPETNLDSLRETKETKKAIEEGKDLIPFEKVTENSKRENLEPLEYADVIQKNEAGEFVIDPVTGKPKVETTATKRKLEYETIFVPRELVIRNGEYLDIYVSLDGAGKFIRIADPEVRLGGFDPSGKGKEWTLLDPKSKEKKAKEIEDKKQKTIRWKYNEKGELVLLEESLKIEKPEIEIPKVEEPTLAGETLSKKMETMAFADRFNFKIGNDGSVIAKLSDIIALKATLGKSKKKEHKWISNAIKDATKIKEKLEKDLSSRVDNYIRRLTLIRRTMNDHLTNLVVSKPVVGETDVKNHTQLEYSIYDKKGNRKKGKDGIDVERDVNPMKAGGIIQNVLNGLRYVEGKMEIYGLPMKFVGDPKRNNIINFGVTGVERIFREIDSLFNLVAYRQEMKFDPKSIDKTKYVIDEGATPFKLFGFNIKVGNALKDLVPVRSVDGALTLFEGLMKQGKAGWESARRIVDARIDRDFIKTEEARSNIKGEVTKAKIEKEYLKRNPDGTFKYQMSYAEMQSKFKLTDAEVTIIRKLDEGLKFIFDFYNEMATRYPGQGAKVIQERPNFDMRSWLGMERAFIIAKKDMPELGIKQNDLLVALPGESKGQLKEFVNYFLRENPEFANPKDFTIKYVTKQKQLGRDGVQLTDAFMEMHKMLEIENPAVAAIVKKTEAKLREKQKLFKGPLKRKGVRGFAGERPGRAGVKDWYQAYASYLDGGIRAAKSMEFKHKVEPMLYNKKFLKDFPESINAVSKYIDNAFGRNPAPLAKMTNTLVDSIAKINLPYFNDIPLITRTANMLTLYKNLLFFNARFLNAQVVQPFQVIVPALEQMKLDYNIKGDITYAVTKGSWETFFPSKEFQQLIVQAVDKGYIDIKFLKEFGIDPTSGRRLESKEMSMAKQARDIATGKNLSAMAERHSRLNALAMFYVFMKSGKYDKTHGKQKMFDDAMESTSQLMVEYNYRARPILYGSKGVGGVMGPLLGLFKTFQHNYYGKTARYVRTWAEHGFKKGGAPLAMHAISQIMTAGLFGIMSIEQIDGIIDWINGSRAKAGSNKDRVPTLSELILQSDASMSMKFGLPSGIVGGDLSSTLTAPGTGLTDVLSFPTLAYWGGLQPKSQNNGVVGEVIHMFNKLSTWSYNDADLYRGLKVSLPPIAQAFIDQVWAGVPWNEYPELFGLVEPAKVIEMSDDHMIFFTKDKDRYVLRDPFKNMKGKIERDAKDFMYAYLSGKSFEESLALKTLWSISKLDRNMKSLKDVHVTGAALAIYNNDFTTAMFHVYSLTQAGYTYDEAWEKIANRMESTNNTVLDRLKGLSKKYNMEKSMFINKVLENNLFDPHILPGSSYQ